jgi:hypothetical protein
MSFVLFSCDKGDLSNIAVPESLDFIKKGVIELGTIHGSIAYKYVLNQTASNEIYFVIGEEDEAKRLLGQIGFTETEPEEIVKTSSRFDVQDWLREKKTRVLEDYGHSWNEILGKEIRTGISESGFKLNKNILTGKYLSKVKIGRILLTHNWELLPNLKYGGWNECPEAHVHGAIWKYWEEKYGAKIVGVSSDVIEAIVKRPPATREQALELAEEHFLYCPDIVFQGVNSISNLSAYLIDNDKWYFWWD